MKKLLVLSMVLASFVSYGQVIEKQTTYVLKMTEQEYNDYVNKKEETHYVKKERNFTRYKGSFGFDGGYTMFMGSSNVFSPSWGAWIDLGKFGVEYHTGVGVNMNDINATNYVNGKTNEWTAGGVSRSVGVFRKRREIYYGGGVQFAEIIGLKNVTAQYKIGNTTYNYNTPTMTDDNKVYPYVTIGYMTKLGQSFSFKSGLIVSKISSINFGFGYNF